MIEYFLDLTPASQFWIAVSLLFVVVGTIYAVFSRACSAVEVLFRGREQIQVTCGHDDSKTGYCSRVGAACKTYTECRDHMEGP